MRSSSGEHYIALDHIRALAAFMVFTWHFTHAVNGYPIPFNYLPTVFPFSVFDEGHTGVALFMTLSGYLFAKLLDGKSINYKAFIWNRLLRLFPLLGVVIVAVGLENFIKGENISNYAFTIVKGALLPSLPNGGWSITVELHYYLLLPLLLWILKKSKLWPLSVIFLAVALRLFLYYERGEIQTLAYWTIVGRIDQFTLGMVAYQLHTLFIRRHAVAMLTIIMFTMYYWYFDSQGGFFQNPVYPSSSPLWIFLPTIEGMAYSILIAWYDNSFSHSKSGISKFIGRMGEYSYSIYLLHFFVVFHAAKFVNERIMNISDFYLAFLWSLIIFILMIIPGYLSFRYIEAPYLKLRKDYIKIPQNILERLPDSAQQGVTGSSPEATL